MTAAPLRGMTVAASHSVADGRATALLCALGAATSDTEPVLRPLPRDRSPAAAWARGGGAALTGDPDGPPLGGPAHVGAAMDGAAAALAALAAELAGRVPDLRSVDVDGPALLGERAAFAGLTRRGTVAPGGACRLLAAADGWLAVNLPRPEDHELLPAWVERTGVDGWASLTEVLRARPAGPTAERGRLLGLPVAPVVAPRDVVTDPQGRARGLRWPVPPWQVRGHAPPDGRSVTGPPRVVDLSSLWAGPLATRLLADVGADVVKVESTARPDGLRAGQPAFFDRLNHASRSVALDLRTTSGVAALRRLLLAADVVVEGSRPRALDQLGCGPDAILGRERPQVWVSITGYGRTGPWAQHPALGDDAGVAGGLTVGASPPRFCADAIADPATGLHAALAALACWAAGGSWHADVAMREVAAGLVPDHPGGLPAEPPAERAEDGWALGGEPVSPPRASPAPRAAPPLGAHTDEVLREVGA